MQMLKSRFCNKFASTKKIFFLQLAVVFSLTSVALWDAGQIINSYVADNRYTLVKVFVANNDTFPFLENTRLRISFTYGETFRELWTNIFKNDDLKIQKMATKDFAAKLASKNYNLSLMSLNDRLLAFELFGDIDNIDSVSSLCAIADLGACSLRKYLYLDDVLKNSSHLEALRNSLWSEIRPNILRPIDRLYTILPEDDPSAMSLSYINHWTALVSIPASILTPSRPWFNYAAGLIGDASLVLNSTLVPSFSIRFTNAVTDFPEIILEKGTMTYVTIGVENERIFDDRATTKCTDETGVEIPAGRSEPECWSRRYLESIAQHCRCAPFTYRQEYRLIKTISNFDRIPSCSPSIYEKCIGKVEKALMTGRPCRPCVTRKNRYSISIKPSPSRRYSDDDSACVEFNKSNKFRPLCTRFTRSKIFFKCDDFSYVIYEERFLLNWSQLLAQVGGDVGLYTGLSIFSVWQFLVFAYDLYKRRRQERIAYANSNSNNKQQTSLARLLINRLTGIGDGGHHKLKDSKKQWKQNVEESILEIRQEIKRNAEMMKNLKKEMIEIQINRQTIQRVCQRSASSCN